MSGFPQTLERTGHYNPKLHGLHITFTEDTYSPRNKFAKSTTKNRKSLTYMDMKNKAYNSRNSADNKFYLDSRDEAASELAEEDEIASEHGLNIHKRQKYKYKGKTYDADKLRKISASFKKWSPPSQEDDIDGGKSKKNKSKKNKSKKNKSRKRK
jgi:hypothetical protein